MSRARRLMTALRALQDELTDAIEQAGFAVSGPTHWLAAENGEPRWVCNARLALAQVTTAPDTYFSRTPR